MLISMNIGNQTVPDIRLPSLIREVKKIYEKLGDGEQSDEIVSNALEHKSSKSGTWLRKRAALKFYDLIDLKNGKIRITEVGKAVCYPKDDKQFNDAVTQMINKVPLWVELAKKYDAYVNKPSTEKVWPDISNLCSIPPEQAKSQSSLVIQYFMEDIGTLKYSSTITKENEMQQTNEAEKQQRPNDIHLITGQREIFKNASIVNPDYTIQIVGPKNLTGPDLKQVLNEFSRILKAVSDTYSDQEQK